LISSYNLVTLENGGINLISAPPNMAWEMDSSAYSIARSYSCFLLPGLLPIISD